MIIKPYIKAFEKLGFGMFVHFGPYSVLGKGEWSKKILNISDEEYLTYIKSFSPKENWADELAETALKSGCKYITLTTRHHDGYSLYDTCGLTEYDSVHFIGRDLVAEFVTACRKYEIIPFFYHTLLDWYQESYKHNFKEYINYLTSSIDVLCSKYGEIGGLWFDGMWDKPDDDWNEDLIYGTIRKKQPNAMIINNTGLSELGALGHIELDSVTFERGIPEQINQDSAPKYVASEMCEIFAEHWGYAKKDLNFKSPAKIIEELAECRRYGSNMLINVGPKEEGSIRLMDRAILDVMGNWTSIFDEAIRKPAPTNIVIQNKPKDFILKYDSNYYLFNHDLPMVADFNVAKFKDIDFNCTFMLDSKIKSVTYLDNNQSLEFIQNGNSVTVKSQPFSYGENLVVRVAKITC